MATTRPETILGDTGLAVHPDDERYAAYVGKLALGTFLASQVDAVVEWQLAHPGSQWVEAERAIEAELA